LNSAQRFWAKLYHPTNLIKIITRKPRSIDNPTIKPRRSVMLVQGVVAGLGSLMLAGASASFGSLIESIGAGAILTVLAETMLPEAYERRGFMVGLSMLLGFLVIILIKFVG
jgi:hypothetical protein